MTENATNPKPSRQDLLDALALWKVAAAAASRDGCTEDLEAAAEDAWTAYSELCNRAAQEGVQP